MTGASLHTKYRPKTLDDVVGQRPVVASMRDAIEAKTQQAFIFEGPSGCGKTTLARIFADSYGDVELVEVDAASNTGVDAVRVLLDAAQYTGFGTDGTAYIIDECHRLSKNAWDAMLKAVEEPAEGIFWFFCTTEPDKVPATIRTRCQTFTLQDVKYRPLMGLVADVCEKEGLDLSEDIIDVIVTAANGSPRMALTNLTSARSAKDAAEAAAMLNRTSAGPIAYDLAKLVVRRGFDKTKAMAMLKQMSEDKQQAESIRHVVRAYLTKAAINGGESYVFAALDEFNKPCIESNQISDLVIKVARCSNLGR